MDLPPEGIWKYPPTQAFVWTTAIALGGLWFGGFAGDNALGDVGQVVSVVMVSFFAGAANAGFVETVVQRERRVASALRMEMTLRYTPNRRI